MQNEVKINSIHKNSQYFLALGAKSRFGYFLCKRVIDIVLASLILVFFFPLMLLVSIGIALSSPGPVFFVQERVGAVRQYDGKRSFWKRTNFPCIKFRTMKIDSDSAIHRAFVEALIENNEEKMTALQGVPTQPRKLVNDPRVTRLGKLLRKLSIDELPQLWNVLRGEMSLVGPRPAIPYEVDMYKPWHLYRLEAQPGLTGLQQVTARSAENFDQQVMLDIQYIEKQSLWLDLKIIIRTPFVIVSAKGAH